MNNYTGCCEFGETQVAANLLGHESYHASHTFWNFIVNGFIDHQRKLHTQPDAEDETDSSSDDASVNSDWEDAEDDTIDALSKRGLDDEGQGMVSKDKLRSTSETSSPITCIVEMICKTFRRMSI